jgi:hypothetical protein
MSDPLAGLDFLNNPNDPVYTRPLDTRPVLESSPEWMAFINALGLEKNQFASDIARREALARQAAKFQVDSLKPQYDQQRRGIAGSAESRGVARSGQFQRTLAESRAGQGRQTTGIQQALQSSISDYESQLAQKRLSLDSQQQQQRATMLAGGYKPFDGAALTRYIDSQKPKTTTGNPQLDAYLASL